MKQQLTGALLVVASSIAAILAGDWLDQRANIGNAMVIEWAPPPVKASVATAVAVVLTIWTLYFAIRNVGWTVRERSPWAVFAVFAALIALLLGAVDVALVWTAIDHRHVEIVQSG